jgi:diguanylate cyclase (GGDEF)-like protein/PAS domain S-box-containing protein
LIGIQSARVQNTSQELDKHQARVQAKLDHEHYFLDALMKSSTLAIVRLDVNHHVITCNEPFEELFGYQCDEIEGQYLDDLIASPALYQEASQITDSVSKGNLERLVSRRMTKDGSLVDVEIVGIPVSVSGQKIGVLGLYHDISHRVKTEAALKESESRFRSLFQDSPISLWEEDFSGVKSYLEGFGGQEEIIYQLENNDEVLLKCIEAVKILNVNQATLDLFNANSKTELLAGLSEILVDKSLSAFRKEIISMAKGELSYDCEIIQRKITGELINGWLRLSVPHEYKDSWKRVFISIIDITERKKTEEKMRYMSFHDALTGVYNRAYFEEELARLTSSRQYPISIIVCDLDGLKQINDEQGHTVGDSAIRAAAQILNSGTFRTEDVVARTGGDEFMIILPAVDINQHPELLERISRGVEKHNKSKLDDSLYRPISISWGYSVAHEGDSLEEAVQQADKNMYTVKMDKYQQKKSPFDFLSKLPRKL